MDEKNRIEQLVDHEKRRFLSLMAASAAFATTSCVPYRPRGKLVSEKKRLESNVPGEEVTYASSCTLCELGCGLKVKCIDGRPVRLEGNPNHPFSKGGLCSRAHASILNLYSPYRLKKPMALGGSRKLSAIAWSKVEQELSAIIKNNLTSQKELVFISHGESSFSFLSFMQEQQQINPLIKYYNYDIWQQNNRKNLFYKNYQTPFPTVKWKELKVLLSLEADLLETDSDFISFREAYGPLRDPTTNKDPLRTYSIEGDLTSFGMNADYRFPLRGDKIYELVLGLVHAVLMQLKIPKTGFLKQAADKVSVFPFPKVIKRLKLPEDKLRILVDDLIKHKGQGLVVAGEHLSPATQEAVNFLNFLLGNESLYQPDELQHTIPQRIYLSSHEQKDLIRRMKEGRVGMVVHLNSNPLYHWSQNTGYAAALKKVPTVISFTDELNETSRFCHYVLPTHHILEQWDDPISKDGTRSLIQPVIKPLFSSRDRNGMLLSLLTKKAYRGDLWLRLIQEKWKKIRSQNRIAGGFKSFWHLSLHDGFFRPEIRFRNLSPFDTGSFFKLPYPPSASSPILLKILKNPMLGDGKMAGNGWLQELPHHVTKQTWGNAALLSPLTASKVGVKDNDGLRIQYKNKWLVLPVLIQLCMCDDLVAVQVGYGRKYSGPIASGVGKNILSLLDSQSFGESLIDGVKFKRAPSPEKVILAQESMGSDFTGKPNNILFERGILQQGDFHHFKEKPLPPSLLDTSKKNKKDLKWGMVIDLNRCIGCTSCTIACNVENNIPAVGKKQVSLNREMSWIRVDRYYTGDRKSPRVSVQPMLCAQCDNAPCEVVCPVSATAHSKDGLSDIAYNRCIGTRYCMSNCPYKVRKFNFFDYQKLFSEPEGEDNLLSKLLHNPEVTLRSRGVVEKCTFCVQRLRKAGRDGQIDQVKTACQQACPTKAILFGNAHNQNSQVYKLAHHPLAYKVLAQLNVEPNVSYLTKLHNSHPGDRNES